MTKDEIFEQVKECIIEVLALDEEVISRHSNLTDDLGAESIDFVEIIHMLCRVFNIEIDREDVYPDRNFLSDQRYIIESIFTDEGAKRLVHQWPHIQKAKIQTHEELVQYLNSLAILADFIEYKITNK